jgi:radical SAM protein with 4Fe4S-binding SPASM domain
MVDTLKDLEKAIDFAQEFDAKEGIQLTSFIAYSKDMENQILKTNENYFKNRITEVLEYANKQGVKFKLQSGDFEENYKQTSSLGHKSCTMPWERVSIQPDGEVYPCPVATKSVGNFFNASIEDIFNSEEMKRFRNGVNSIENMNDDCSRCMHCRHKSINNDKNNSCADVDTLYSQMTRKKSK